MSQARLELHCRGVVQGVGFRPLVHGLASELGLVGELRNLAGAVKLDLQGERRQLEQLLQRLPAAVHPPARLDPLEPRWMAPQHPAPRRLSIAAAPAQPLGAALVARALVPDLAPCSACLAELRDPADRRYRYPLISCSRCGPRFSIATAEPYARAHTTMAPFGLCAACEHEFADPASRRFHAETIACPGCGPQLAWRVQAGAAAGADAPAADAPAEAALQAAIALLRQGGILALQGVGGFQLLVDAASPAAIARLRQRKRRARKPFAVLVADVSWVEPWCVLSAPERALLQGVEAPIVLLRRRCSEPAWPAEVAPGCAELGVMLPASPLHVLLVEGFGGPLVCTSGNHSGEPLCLNLEEAWQRLGPGAAGGAVADGWLTHNRAIARGLDDSLLRWSAGRPQMLRRARGYAPLPLALPGWASGDRPLLALGGDLKAAPALASGKQVWLAPQLGDLAAAALHERWQQGLAALLARHDAAIETMVCDLHPGYVSRRWAQQWAWAEPTRQLFGVQHHRAHGLAALAEAGVAPPALLLACDGLGYGEAADPLWGGEGLLLDAAGEASRLLSLRPIALVGGELAQREPRRSALALVAALGEDALAHAGAQAVHEAFEPAERSLLLQALRGGCWPQCSSLGRLFDGAASLLALVQRQSYEGEGGLLLQGAAASALAAGLGASPQPSSMRLPLVPAAPGSGARQWLDWQPLIETLLEQRAGGVDAALSALAFHRALIEALSLWAARAAAATGVRRVVLAGGCFQNRLLLEGLIGALQGAGLEPVWAQQLPCSDGALAVGQVAAARLAGA